MKVAALGDVAEFINGFAFKPSDWEDDGIPIIRIQNLTDPSKPINRTTRAVPEKFRVRRGELLVSWSATLGVFTWDRSDEALVNQHIFRVIPSPRVDAIYLRHMLANALIDMQAHLHGATMQHVNRGAFLATTIPLPSIEEQRRIAAILDRADTIRAKRRQVFIHLDALVGALFDARFGSLTAVTELEDVCRKITDGTHQPPDWTDDGVPFLFVSNITSGEINLQTKKYISAETWETLTRRSPIELGDVLYSTVGTFGIPALVRSTEPFAFQRHIAHIKPDITKVDPVFLTAQMASVSVKQQASRAARGIAQPTVNLGEIKRFKIVTPPLAEQRSFAAEVEQLRANRIAVQSARRMDDELFASLQSRAFRGEL